MLLSSIVMKYKQHIIKYSFLIIASLLFYFTGMRYAFFLAPWIAFIFFIFYFRQENKWYDYLAIILLLIIPKFFIVHNGWEISIWLELAAAIFTLVPILFALLADKYFYRKLPSILATLVFPATYIIFD